MKVLIGLIEKYRSVGLWSNWIPFPLRGPFSLNGVMVVVLALLLAMGCSPRRHLPETGADLDWQAQGREVRNQYLQTLEAGQLDFQAMSARAKGFMTLNEQENHEVTLQLRLQKDRAIWVSATAMLGMEVGRMLIQPDSIVVINRIEGTFQIHPYEKIEEWLGYHVVFSDLQDLLTGNAGATLDLRGLQYFTSAKGQSRFYRKDAAELIFDPDSRLVLWQIRNYFGELLSLQHAYNPSVSGPRFPTKTSISFQTPRLKLITTLDYTRQELLEHVELPFSIPKGYRQVY